MGGGVGGERGQGCLTHFKLIRRLRRHVSLKRSVGMGGGVGGERGQGGEHRFMKLMK